MNDAMLSKLEPAVRMLAECESIPDAKKIADMAEAARTYARSAQLGLDAINYATRIKLRAERRMGEILRDAPKNGGTAGQGRPHLGGSEAEPPKIDTSTPTLADMGLTKKQSSRAQKLAEVSDEQFEALVNVVEEVKGEITTAAVMREVAGEQREEVHAQKTQAAALSGQYSVIYADPHNSLLETKRADTR